MNRIDAYKKLSDVFCEILDVDEIILEDSTTANNVKGWDSLSHLRIILSIEKEFNIDFSIDEVANFETVGQMIDAILLKL